MRYRTHIVRKMCFQVLYFSIFPKGSRLYLSGMANSPSVKSKISTATGDAASTGEWASALCRLAALLLPATGELADTFGAGRQLLLWCWRKCDARSNERTSIFPSQLAHSTNSWTSAEKRRGIWNSLSQCCGSMTFWCGSGSADPCLWLMNPYPDPSI